MDKTHALELWGNLYGDAPTAFDYAAHPIRKEEFENPDSPYGWTFDFVKPLASGGNPSDENLIPTALSTMMLRNGKTAFTIGSKLYEVRCGARYGTYALYDVTERGNPIDMTPTVSEPNPGYNHSQENLQQNLTLNAQPIFDFPGPNLVSALHPIMENPVTPAGKPQDSLPAAAVNAEESVPLSAAEEEKAAEKPLVLEKLSETQPIPSEEKDANKPVAEDVSALDDLRRERDDLEKKVASQTQDITDLNARLEVLDDRLAEKEKQGTLAPEMERTETVSDAEKEARQEVDERDQQIQKQNEQLAALRASLLDAVSKNDALTAETSSLKTAAEAQKQQLDQTETDKEAALSDVKALRQEKEADAEKLNEAFSSTQEALRQKEAQWQQETENSLKQFEDQKAVLSQQLIEKQKATDDLTAALNAEKAKETQETGVVSGLTESLSAAEKAETDEAGTVQELNAKIMALTASLDALRKEADDKAVACQSTTAEVMSLTQTVKDLTEKNDAAAKEADDLQTKNATLTASLADAEKSALSLTDEKEKLSASLSDEGKVLSEKESELSSLNGQLTELAAQLSDKEKECVAEKDQVTKLTAQLTEKEEALTQTNADLTVADNQAKEETAENTEKTKALSAATAQIAALTAQLNQKDSQEKEAETAQQIALSASEKQVQTLTDELSEKGKKLSDDETALVTMSKESADRETLATAAIAALKATIESDEEKLAVLTAGASLSAFDDVKAELLKLSLPFTAENVRKLLPLHLAWRSFEAPLVFAVDGAVESASETLPDLTPLISEQPSENVSFLADDIAEEKQAKELFGILFGIGKEEGTDFAGRRICFDDFRAKTALTGWDYRKFDEKRPLSAENVVIASYRSLADFRSDVPFSTNGHSYHVVDADGKAYLSSDDYVTDPYNFDQAMAVTDRNVTKDSPLIYLFVKLTGVTVSDPDSSAVHKFLDIIDRTVKRCCPKSFLEMQAMTGGNTDYAFITFDGTVDGAYVEALDYAILVNSYRKQFRDQNLVNAVIVLDQLVVPNSSRHLSYERLFTENKDMDLKALRYDLSLSSVINATIKRTIHIGPEILPKLKVDKSKLILSRIGQGNFSDIYSFKANYYEYHLVFDLRHNTSEDEK